MGGMKVTILVDNASISEDEKNKEFKKSWVMFDLPKNIKTDLSDKKYRSRKELYYFHCGQELYAVSHVILLDDNNEVIYDSGKFDPYSSELKDTWKLIKPLSGPDLINTYVCKLEPEKNQTAKKSPEWMKKQEPKELEIPSLNKIESGGNYSLAEIRWALRDEGMERLVFDIYSGNEKVSKPENYEIIDEARDMAMDVFFKGYENTGTTLPDLAKSNIIKEIVVSNNEDANGVNIKLLFKNSPAYEVFEVENPGRLVIDFTPRD